MVIKKSQQFMRQFAKLPEGVVEKFSLRLRLYLDDPTNALLRNHKLQGVWQGYRSINITGDYRLIFKHDEEALWLVAIGTHSQLYG